MALSHDEKALAEAAYARANFRHKYWRSGLAGACIGLVPTFFSIFKTIEDPHSSHRLVVIFSGLMGAALGMGIFSSFATSRLQKRDEELIRLMEHHFPDECSWKQEERILAEAEDIRLKAKVDQLIHQSGC